MEKDNKEDKRTVMIKPAGEQMERSLEKILLIWKSIGQGKMVCSGVSVLKDPDSNTGKYELGGLSLLDMKNFKIKYEVPVIEFSPEGHAITRNPVFLKKSNNAVKLFAVPEESLPFDL